MNTGLRGRVVMVTGASSTIGRAVALAFAAEGARVAVTYQRNREGADRTVGEVAQAGSNALAIELDLQDDASIDEAFLAVERTWNASAAVLVNNAVTSGAPWGPLDQLSAGRVSQTLRANLEGTIAVTQAAVRGMRHGDFGRIVFISSIVAEDGLSGGAVYSAAKAAINGLTRSLARELGSIGILTNAILPGLTAVDDGREFPPAEVYEQTAIATPTGRLTRPEEIARLAVFLGSEANGHVNGELVRVSGGPSSLS